MTRWQVFSAVALKRLPELRPQKDLIETKVQQIFDAYEVAKSRYSKHELQMIEDKKALESEDSDIVVKETAQDREDRWLKDASTFVPGNYDDRLAKTQLMFIKQKFGSHNKDQWLLPQLAYDENQDGNLVDTARRALRESLSIVNGFTIVSRIPISVYSFKYPKKVVPITGYDGAKVFFINAHLDQPSPQVLEAIDAVKNDNLKWLTGSEAYTLVAKGYMKSLSSGLLSEKRVDIRYVIERAKHYNEKVNKFEAERARC